MAINGNNIIITVGGNAIAGTKSNEIQSDMETIEISSATDSQWKAFVTGRKSWSFTTNFLVLANSDVRRLLTVGTKYTIVIGARGAQSTDQVTGSAILTSCKISATRGTLAQGSFSFQGTGALHIN